MNASAGRNSRLVVSCAHESFARKRAAHSVAARGFSGLLAVCASLALSSITVSAQEIGTYAFVDAQALNLREAPNTRSPVIRALPQGTVVSILDRNGAWARIFVQGSNGAAAEGWLSTHFLGRDADISAGHRSPAFNNGPSRRSGRFHPSYERAGLLRVSKLDFDEVEVS